jgi:colicin import membrane protein
VQKQEEQRQEQERKQEEDRVALERKQAEEKAAEQQKQREAEAERKRQQEAEEKRLAEAKRKAAEERAKAEALRVQAERDAELRKSLDAEERLNALRSSGALANWLGQIANKVQRAWIRPPGARPGISCVIRVTQTPGGEVTNVSIGECNGDAALRESIESAVYRASPLPPAPDPAVFDRNLAFTFKPND